MNTRDMIRILLSYYSDAKAVYLFGNYGTEAEWPDSDIDLAFLFPFQTAVAAKKSGLSSLPSGFGTTLGTRGRSDQFAPGEHGFSE